MEELCDDRAEEIKIEIAGALGAGKRISLKEEPSVCCYQFSFQGEEAVLCHGVGHPTQPVPAKTKNNLSF